MRKGCLHALVACVIVTCLCPMMAHAQWVQSQRAGNIAYFLFAASNRIERLSTANSQWLSPITLPQLYGPATALAVDTDTLYVAFGPTANRYNLNGGNETHIVDTPQSIQGIFTDGNLILLNHSGSLYARVTSINKSNNAVIAQFENYVDAVGGAAIAPSINVIYGRSIGVSPSDITYVSYYDDGTFYGGGDSPYHMDYPSASRVWIFPGEAMVVDNSGTVYDTWYLTYLGNLEGPFTDLDFYGTDSLVVLRGTQLVAYAYSGVVSPLGIYTLPVSPKTIYMVGNNVFAFTWDDSLPHDIRINTIPLTDLKPPAPTGVSASDCTYSNSVSISWNASSFAMSYEVWRSTRSSFDSASMLAQGLTTTNYIDNGVTQEMAYCYWVKAVNVTGNSDFSLPDTGIASVFRWTAYNDAAWAADDVVGGFAGSFSTNNPGGLASGTLSSEGGQLLVGTTVSMAANASSFSFFALGGLGTTNFTWPAGTDAANEFEGKIGRGYACQLQGTAPLAMVTVTLSGLDPNRQYKLVVWCSRLADSIASNYSNRLTDVTLLDVDSFLNNSSVAYNVKRSTNSMPQDTTTLPANMKDGYAPVARYELIRPGTNGLIKFTVKRNALSSGNAYFNAFKLAESDAVPGGDTDADGMADTWEQQYFGSTSATTGGMLEDFDHDGSINYDEYRAGTDPTTANSRFALVSELPLPGAPQTILQWSGVTGRSYSLQNTTNLLQAWTTPYTGIPGVSPMNSYTVNTSSVHSFWRVKVE